MEPPKSVYDINMCICSVSVHLLEVGGVESIPNFHQIFKEVHDLKWIQLLMKNLFSFFLKKVLFIYLFILATLHSMQDLSSQTRDITCAPCNESEESQPLDHQVSPQSLFLMTQWWTFSKLEDNFIFF